MVAIVNGGARPLAAARHAFTLHLVEASLRRLLQGKRDAGRDCFTSGQSHCPCVASPICAGCLLHQARCLYERLRAGHDGSDGPCSLIAGRPCQHAGRWLAACHGVKAQLPLPACRLPSQRLPGAGGGRAVALAVCMPSSRLHASPATVQVRRAGALCGACMQAYRFVAVAVPRHASRAPDLSLHNWLRLNCMRLRAGLSGLRHGLQSLSVGCLSREAQLWQQLWVLRWVPRPLRSTSSPLKPVMAQHGRPRIWRFVRGLCC